MQAPAGRPHRRSRRRAVSLAAASAVLALGIAGPALAGFAGAPPAIATTPDPSPAAAAPTPTPACVTSVGIGPLTVNAECFQRDGLTWYTSGPVDLGGMKMDPGPDARFTVDPFNARVAARGYSMRVVGPFAGVAGQVQAIKLIQEGDFDIAFQRRDDADRSTRFIGTAGGQAISLQHIATLPGLSDVATLPEVTGPDGRPLRRMPDYSRVPEADVASLDDSGRVPGGVTGPTVAVSLADLGLPRLERFVFSLPPGVGDFLGLDLTGSATAIPERLDGTFGFTIEVESTLRGVIFDKVAGEVRLFVAPNGVARADRLRFRADQIAIPGVARIKPVDLEWDGRESLWRGKATLFVPAVSETAGFGADWRVKDGVLQRIGVTVGVPIVLGNFTISSLGGVVEPRPFLLEAQANVGFGPPAAAVAGPLVDVDGTLRANDAGVRLAGEWSVGGRRLGTSSMEIDSGAVAIAGRLDTRVGNLAVQGQVEGFAAWAPGFHFNVEGAVDVRFATWSARGVALASSRGMAVCAKVDLGGPIRFGLGGGFLWGADAPRWLDGTCDMGAFRVARGSMAHDGQQADGLLGGAPAASVVAVPRTGAMPTAVALRVTGTDAAPALRIAALGITTGDAPANGPGWLSIPDPDARTTTVIVLGSRLARGRAYTVSSTDGVAPLARVETAPVVTEPTLSGRVGTGRLSLDVRGADALLQATQGAPAPVIDLVERGPGVNRPLGRFALRSRTLAFTPGRGPAGRREVVARIEQDGLPRTETVIARFSAPASTLARPRVRLARTGATMGVVRWSRVGGATGYQVAVRANGHVEQYQFGPARRSLRLDAITPETGARVTVRAQSTYPEVGPPGSADMLPALSGR